jgi:16S rRNA (uracil1498-N3)-methyltransferase
MAFMAAKTRIHAQSRLRAGEVVRLSADAATHLLRVLRLREGDELTIFDGTGKDFPGRILRLGRQELSVELGSPVTIENESPLAITLLQGLCRGARMDTVIQKATELGVARLLPVATERSVVRLNAKQARQKLSHWEHVAISACEQSGRSVIPEIQVAQSLASALDLARDLPVRILLDPAAQQTLLDLPPSTQSAALLVGPEGGLTESEREISVAKGFTPLRLGPRTLRTETAPLAALAVLQFKYGDLAG